VLWYKAWLETRTRFLVCLIFVVAVLVFFVHHAEGILPAEPKSNAYELMFYAHFYLAGLWVLCVVLLGMGGLLREKSSGVSSFTLAFPVSRTRLVMVRTVVGVVESIVLGVVPWAAMLLVIYLGGKPFSLSQAGFYVLLLVGGGLVYFAMSILISALIEGEYTTPAVAYGAVILVGAVCGSVKSLRPFFDLWRFITADKYYDRSTHLLSGPAPWFGISASLTVAVCMLLATIKVIQKRDF